MDAAVMAASPGAANLGFAPPGFRLDGQDGRASRVQSLA